MRYTIARRRPSTTLHRPAWPRAAALLAGVVALAAATAAPAWQYTLNGAGNAYDRALAVLVDGAGDVVATGSLPDAPNVGFFATWPVIKLDGASGAQLWRTDVTGTNPFLGDEGRALALDPAGNVVAAGYSTNNGTIFDFTVAKLAGGTGAVLWRSDVDGLVQVYDQARDVVVDGNGDVLAGGGLMETGSGIASDIAIVKLAGGTGAELWRSTIDGALPNGEDYANAIALDAANDVIAAGSLTTLASYSDLAVAKFAGADGTVLWQRSFSGGFQTYAYDVAVDGTGDAVAVGLLGQQGFVGKLRGSDGAVLWQRALTGTASVATNAYQVAVDAAGDVYVAGSAYELYSGTDLVVWKLASGDGHELWRRAVTTRGESYSSDYGTSLALDGQGNVAVGGLLGNHVALLRLRASDGVELMRHVVDPDVDGYGSVRSVAFDPAGDIVAAGGVEDESTGTEEDFFVTKVPGSGPIEGCGNGVVESWEQCDDGNDSWTDACLPACVSNYCVDGAAITDAKLVVHGGRAVFQGRLDVGPSGLPGGFSPSTRGAQLLVETPSDNERPMYVNLTAATHGVPTAAAGGCGAGDGWRVRGGSQTYGNASGALDPPGCTAGSAAGLQLLKVDDRTARGRGIRFKIRMHDLPALPRGPLRLTLVLGGSAADAAGGACGIVTFTDAECVAKTRSFQCR